MAAIVGHRRILIAAAAVLGIAAALAWAAAPGSARPAAHPGTYGYLSRHAVAALAATSWQGGAVQATNGETVTVYVSTSYGTSVGALQWADFFTGLIHGSEISAISIYVATPAEVVAECGRADVLGCYGNDRLLIPGETSDGVDPEEIARHEYGHHVAQHRLNPPWRGLDSGPKQWASYEGVCARVGAGTAFPGDEGDNYRLNPGEAFAENYRVLNFQKQAWPSWTVRRRPWSSPPAAKPP